MTVETRRDGRVPPLPVDGAHRQILVLREVVGICSRLSNLASQDTEATAVLELLTAQLDVSAALYAPDLGVLGASSPLNGPAVSEVGPKEADLRRLFAVSARTRRPLAVPAPGGTAVIAPVVLGAEPAAFLVAVSRATDERGEDLHVLVTEHAATVCGIVVGRARDLAAAAGRARRDLFEALLLPERGADVDQWARHLGLDLGRDHRVVTVHLGRREPTGWSDDRREEAALVERFLSARASNVVVVQRGEEVVAIVPALLAEPQGTRALLHLLLTCKEVVESRFPELGVVVGVGNAYPGAGSIARSYGEARHAVDASRVLAGLGGVVAFDDLGIHRLLARVADPAELRAFAHDVLGELAEPERQLTADFLNTLTVYFQENHSPKQAARRLHVHPNTVGYRLKRIEEITGLSLTSYHDRLSIQVALEIANGTGAKR